MSFGVGSLGRETKDAVNFSGTMTMNDTTVTGATSIQGMLTANGAQLSALTVTGTASLNKTTCTGAVDVSGMLKAVSSIFESTITARSKSTQLQDCTARSIRIEPNSGGGAQEVVLAGSTTVNGDIEFVAEGGKVTVSPSATLTGNVINGIRSNL